MRMPRVTGTLAAARVVRWFCEEGQTVREGDEVIHVRTVTTEMRLPSPFNGTIKEILVDEGDEVREGDVLAVVE
jgi:pyruvate dehydrogenase E2 component (dihydrolipoamide acetyltransferase)